MTIPKICSHQVIPVAVAMLCLALSGCCTTNSSVQTPVVRQPTDSPERFLPVHTGTGEQNLPVGTCRSPLADPRDGTRIRLVRSAAGQGDYEVPPETYGVKSGELLRIDCATGKVLGIVLR